MPSQQTIQNCLGSEHDDKTQSKHEAPPQSPSGSDEWYTPRKYIEPLQQAIGGLFDVDPCSGCEPAPIAKTTYTKEDDGLSKRWYGKMIINPPYSDPEKWVKRAAMEQSSTSSDVEFIIALVRGDTSTNWFHSYGTKATHVLLADERIKFGDANTTPRFPSVFLCFGDVPERVLETMRDWGRFVTPEVTFDNQITLTELSPDDKTRVEVSSSDAGAAGKILQTGYAQLEIETDVIGTPNAATRNPRVSVETVSRRGETADVLTYDPVEETWYCIKIKDGRVYGAVDGGNGWEQVALKSISSIQN